MKKKGAKMVLSHCNILEKNHRGSHVGVVISFVIFVTFLTFLYAILQPAIKLSGDEPGTLKYIEEKIIENTSRSLTVIT